MYNITCCAVYKYSFYHDLYSGATLQFSVLFGQTKKATQSKIKTIYKNIFSLSGIVKVSWLFHISNQWFALNKEIAMKQKLIPQCKNCM